MSVLLSRTPTPSTGALSLPAVLLGTVGFALLLLAPAQAQDLRIGLRAGPSFGFLNDSPVPFVSEPGVTAASTNVRLDGHVGLHVVVPVGAPVALQPELLFVQKGGHLSRVGEDLYSAERYRLSYLQGHLLARRTVSIPGPLSLHAVAGPSISVATGGTVRRDLRSRTTAVDQEISLLPEDLMRRWDAGLLLGAGLEYPAGGGRTVALELRYNAGLRTIFTGAERPASALKVNLPDPPPLSATPPPLRHDVILASLTLTVPLRR
jgi:hypothetical protein